MLEVNLFLLSNPGLNIKDAATGLCKLFSHGAVDIVLAAGQICWKRKQLGEQTGHQQEAQRKLERILKKGSGSSHPSQTTQWPSDVTMYRCNRWLSDFSWCKRTSWQGSSEKTLRKNNFKQHFGHASTTLISEEVTNWVVRAFTKLTLRWLSATLAATVRALSGLCNLCLHSHKNLSQVNRIKF